MLGRLSIFLFALLLAIALADITGAVSVVGVDGKRIQTAAKQTTPTRCVIKGNISKSGERIYHIPGGAYYKRTKIDTSKGERWFCSEAEAQRAGWRKSRR